MAVVNTTTNGLGPAVQHTGGYYYNPTVTTSTGTHSVLPFPDTKQEFGRAFDVSDQMMSTPDFEITVMSIVMRDYQQTKMQSFPGWKGFPEIKVMKDLQGMKVGWYALVDKEEIFNVAEEDNLWQS